MKNWEKIMIVCFWINPSSDMDDMNKFFEKWSEQLLKVHHEMDLQLLGYRILFTIIEIKLFF